MCYHGLICDESCIPLFVQKFMNKVHLYFKGNVKFLPTIAIKYYYILSIHWRTFLPEFSKFRPYSREVVMG